MISKLHEWDNIVIHVKNNRKSMLTRCSAIAERPRCGVR